MSSKPGWRLEDFLMWDLDITVDEQPDSNFSLQMAEALGNVERRRSLSVEQFAPIVALFEPHRERVEYWLSEFDEETQSWRDYAGYAFDFIPNDLIEQAKAMIAGLETKPATEGVELAPQGVPMLSMPFDNTILFCAPPTHAYNWRPREDMTAYELALCLPIFFTNFGWSRTQAIDALPAGARRHFERVEAGGPA